MIAEVFPSLDFEEEFAVIFFVALCVGGFTGAVDHDFFDFSHNLRFVCRKGSQFSRIFRTRFSRQPLNSLTISNNFNSLTYRKKSGSSREHRLCPGRWVQSVWLVPMHPVGARASSRAHKFLIFGVVVFEKKKPYPNMDRVGVLGFFV
jgi:hypothetical protein